MFRCSVSLCFFFHNERAGMDKVFQKVMYQYDSNEGMIRLDSPDPSSELILVLYNADWQRDDGIKYTASRRAFRNLIFPEMIGPGIGRVVFLFLFSHVGPLPPFSRQISSLRENQRRDSRFQLVRISFAWPGDAHRRRTLRTGILR